MDEREILTGWKEIEAFIGFKSEAIRRLGFPVRKKSGTVLARKSELVRYIHSIPILQTDPANEKKGKTQ